MTIDDVILLTPDGDAARLGDVIDRPTVIVVVRYFG